MNYRYFTSIHLAQCFVIFSVVVCLRLLYYHFLSSITYISREYRYLVAIIDGQSMVFANDRIHFGLLVLFVYLQITPSHYHHYADLSEGIELLKYLSGICNRVCLRLRQFSQVSFLFNRWGCVSSAYPINSPVMISRMRTLPYYQHKIGSMDHYCWGRSWNNGMHCMSYPVLNEPHFLNSRYQVL